MKSKNVMRNYIKDKETLKNMLEEFNVTNEHGQKIFRYREQLTKIAHREQTAFVIDVVDIKQWDEDLYDAIKQNAKRYVIILRELIQEMLPNFKERTVPPKDSLDVYIEHRLLMEQRNQFPGEQQDPRMKYAPELMRRFEVKFQDSAIDENSKEPSKIYSVRELTSDLVGQLLTVKGVVSKSTEVKPLVTIATYTCDQCSAETYQEITGMSYMPLRECQSEDCKLNKSGGRLNFQTRASKFIKFQEMKIQELSNQVPTGHIPRSLTVHCKGETTRQCQPGDHIILTGIFLPMRKGSFQFMMNSSQLMSDSYIDAHAIISVSNADSGDDNSKELTSEELEILSSPDLYNKMAMSIAPEIYGLEDVKKALLLLLVGGTDKVKGSLKIRGNINICLMGDPGVAKSQLLSFITRLSPRSQFTTGRGSSGVGLTAAVVKDPLTGQMMLEGGALVLSDQGICCIDEFDKMTESDRTAIHEVMEQQTISIAKAGIMTRLNARVSILAAANPAYGKYNPKRSIEQNVALPAALLSRFDLLWLHQDVPDYDKDKELAEHITYVHRTREPPPHKFDVIDMSLIRKYIQVCKRKTPVIPESLSEKLVDSYVEMRKEARNSQDGTFTSPRNILAVLRLSTALARLRLADVVDKHDIDEAIRLVKASKNSINNSQPISTEQKKTTLMLQIIREIAGNRRTVKVADILERCTIRGLKRNEIINFIEECDGANMWHINQNKTHITLSA